MSESNWLIAGRYRVLDRIGAGGMADVLRARDEMLDRTVAVKVFRSVPTAPDGTVDTAKGVERQQAELAALARLNHPNLTLLYDGSIVGQDGPAYLVMEFVDGPSLDRAIEDGAVTELQTRVLGAQIADALAYVHSAGMVHRDVKPANILLGRDAPGGGLRSRLTDFGIVRLVGSEPLTRADMTLGSASYLAPEQARGSAVGPPADVYSLGLTLLETLTGRRAFEGPALEAVVARLSNDPEIPSGLPEPWPGLLRAMTARDPASRPPAGRVAAVLRGAEAMTAPITSVPAGTYDTAVLPAAVPVSATAPPPRVPPARRPPAPGPAPRRTPPLEPRRRVSVPLIIAGILVLALVIAGIALLIANSGGSSSPGPASSPPSTGRSSPPSTSSQNSATTSPSSSHHHRTHSSSPSDSEPSSTPSSPEPSSTASTSKSSPRTSASSRSTSKSSGRAGSGPAGGGGAAGGRPGAGAGPGAGPGAGAPGPGPGGGGAADN